jgi:hypothetical protein
MLLGLGLFGKFTQANCCRLYLPNLRYWDCLLWSGTLDEDSHYRPCSSWYGWRRVSISVNTSVCAFSEFVVLYHSIMTGLVFIIRKEIVMLKLPSSV